MTCARRDMAFFSLPDTQGSSSTTGEAIRLQRDTRVAPFLGRDSARDSLPGNAHLRAGGKSARRARATVSAVLVKLTPGGDAMAT